MKKTELKEIARKTMQEAIGCAYYKIADNNEYSEEEQDAIIQYINKLGEAACKAIKTEYITY